MEVTYLRHLAIINMLKSLYLDLTEACKICEISVNFTSIETQILTGPKKIVLFMVRTRRRKKGFKDGSVAFVLEVSITEELMN